MNSTELPRKSGMNVATHEDECQAEALQIAKGDVRIGQFMEDFLEYEGFGPPIARRDVPWKIDEFRGKLPDKLLQYWQRVRLVRLCKTVLDCGSRRMGRRAGWLDWGYAVHGTGCLLRHRAVDFFGKLILWEPTADSPWDQRARWACLPCFRSGRVQRRRCGPNLAAVLQQHLSRC